MNLWLRFLTYDAVVSSWSLNILYGTEMSEHIERCHQNSLQTRKIFNVIQNNIFHNFIILPLRVIKLDFFPWNKMRRIIVELGVYYVNYFFIFSTPTFKIYNAIYKTSFYKIILIHDLIILFHRKYRTNLHTQCYSKHFYLHPHLIYFHQ